MAAPQHPNLIGPAEWNDIVSVQNQNNVQYVTTSWAGWHPTSLVTLHKMSYKYGIDISQEATDTARRLSDFYTRFLAHPANHGIKVWCDEIACVRGNNVSMPMLAATYLHSLRTYAILDVRDSLCLQDYLLVSQAAAQYNANPGNQNVRDSFLGVLDNSKKYDYRPKRQHSFWTRGWLPQEQLYSRELTYVHQINHTDPVVETTRLDCYAVHAHLVTALHAIRTADASLAAHAPTVSRLLSLGISINLRPSVRRTRWEAYLRAASFLPKRTIDSGSMSEVMSIINLDIGTTYPTLPDPMPRPVREIIASALRVGWVPVPRLFKAPPMPGYPNVHGSGWCYNALIDYDPSNQFFSTTDIIVALGRVRAGVTTNYMPEAKTTLFMRAPVMSLDLPLTIPRLRPQKDYPTGEEPEAPLPDTGTIFPAKPEGRGELNVVKQGLVVANYIGDQTAFTLIALGFDYCWVALPEVEGKHEVVGYVDNNHLAGTAGFGDPASWTAEDLVLV